MAAGDSGVTINSGNSTGTVTLSGSIAQVNNLLTGAGTGTITYLNGLDNPSGSTTLTVTVNDGGNSGNDPGTSGTAATEEGSNSVLINITAVNDTPIDLITTSISQSGISLNEDGGNDTYLLADNGLPSPLSQFTFEVQFEGNTFSNEVPFISYNTSSGDVLTINTMANNTLELDIGTGAVAFSSAIDYNATLMDGQRHTLSVSWDNTAGDWSIYIDGALIDSGTGLSTGQTIPTGGTLMFGLEQDSIGGTFESHEYFNGELYDIRLFDGVRTATEVATHYNQTLPSNEAGMLANWIFDNLSSSGRIVESVSGNNLTVQHASGTGFSPSYPELVLSVSETTANGTVVGTLSTIDPDSGDSFTYTLLDSAGGRFDIDSVNGNITVLNASLIDYQTVTSHNITIEVTDAGGLTYNEIFTIQVVQDKNEAPVGAAIEKTALSYTENDGAVPITSTLAISDVDNTHIQSAVVQFTAGYTGSEDVLSFRDQNGITGSFDATTGILTLTGNATLGQYETALRSITYSNSSENPNTTTRTVSFTVNDGNANSHAQTRDIAITAVNDSPTLATNNGTTVAEGGQVTITSTMLNEGDPDDAGTGLTYTVTNGPTNGQLELTTNSGVAITSFTQDDIDNNRLIFVHNGTQATTDSFDFSLADGGEDGATPAVGAFNFNVTNVNDAPVLTGANDLAVINEDPANNDGTLVSALISGQVTDSDSGSVEGIAVTGVDDTNGTWQYTTDGGTTWTAFGTVDTANARLLPPMPTPQCVSYRTRIGTARSPTASASMPGIRPAAPLVSPPT